MTLKEIQERLAKWFKKGVVYNISEGKQFTVKEQRPMPKKMTIEKLSTTVEQLAAVVNNLVITVKDLSIEMRAGFAEAKADRESIRDSLHSKIDNIVKLNNLKT